MKTSQTARSRYRSWITSAALWAAVLLVTGLIGGLWFLSAADSAGYAVPAVVAITAVVSFTWQRSRARARRRKAALDAYAEREIARAAARSGQFHRKRRLASPAALDQP